jgi:asparagine synthase (glutamine-hydrolysing)
VHGFGRWGFRSLLDRLRGMFALVLLDQRELAAPVLYAAVDHVGMKPLVWWFDTTDRTHGPRLAIASDSDALLGLLSDDPSFTRRLDGQALAHVLSLGYCPAPWTVWRGVHKLAPGQMMTWRRAGTAAAAAPMIERYWSPPEVLEPASPTSEQHGFESLLRSVVDEHLLSDVPVGLFLSAGLDSSSIALALAQGGHADDVTAYTLSPAGADPAIDEAPTAAAMCRAMMMRHRTIPFEPGDVQDTLRLAAQAFDEPQGFTALLTAIRIARQTRLGDPTTGSSRPGPTVVLAGDGGDEALAGYPWHTQSSHPLALHEIDGSRRAATISRQDLDRLADPACDAALRSAALHQLGATSYTHRYLCRVFPGFHPGESRALLAGLEPEYDESVFASWLGTDDRPALPHPRRSQRLDLFGFCAGSILPKIDRSAMIVALELRAPFLDRRVLEWSLTRSVHPDETVPGAGKPRLRAMLSSGVRAGLVPPQTLSRPKQGFSLKLPARDTFQLLAKATLTGSRVVRDGVLRHDWSSFLPADPEAREIRAFTLCMLGAWYEARVP